MHNIKRLRIAILLLIGTILFGMTGYHLIEGMTWFESLYMTVITISTVGFMEMRPLSTAGRVLTMTIISTGITLGAYTLGTALRLLIEGEIKKTFGRRRLEKTIAHLHDHYIICGYGRIGSLICHELRENKIPFAVIESDPALTDALEAAKINYLPLDATTEDALKKAGIMTARGIVTAVKSDADNVFITLTARGLRSDIFILARASEEKNEAKLIRAGASRVMCPYLIGGRKMAQLIIRPAVVDFIDIAMRDTMLDLVIEEARVRDNSPFVGRNLIESNLRRDFGVIIVAIKKNSGEMKFNPHPEEKLAAGDVIVVMGKKDDLKRMNSIL